MEDGSVSLTEVERELVLKLKEAKRSNLVPGSKWNLVDIKWMRQWCNYVNYDGIRSRYVDISNPGPMKNTSLLEDSTNKLKRNLLEDLDYYLVPSELYKTFEELYGGGPDVVRNVVPCSGNSRVYMVDLYPMKYNVYVVDGSSNSSSDEASPVPSEPRAVIEQSKYTGFDDVKASVMKALSLSEEPTHYNIWVRKPDYYTSYATTADDEPDMPAEDQGEVRRYLKESKTDTLPGSWVFLKEDEVIYTHHYPNGTIDMLVELLSEPLLPTALEAEEEIMLTPAKAVLVKELREDANSRRGLLSHWLKDLRIGDVVDGKDISGKWYEAVVVPLPPTAEGEHPPPAGSVRLHFKCWSAKWDDTVLPKDIPGRIWPLYSKTPNWRSALRAGDYVEVLTSAPDAVPRWEAATVSSVDLYRGFVKLRYSQEFKTLSLQSDSICQHPTHVKEVSRPASSAITISSSSGSYLSSAYRSTSNWMSGGRSHEAGALQAGGAPGVVGLRNLGNTCFMNSMLQCLSHAKPLTDVFLSDRYLGQINTDNVLGMGGKIANVYGKLLKDMWAQKYSVVNPYEFKDTIGEFQPQFAGYQQQDSQEFMLYLLDGLHEDMNRVIKKPFVEKIESKGRADDLISREAWRRFLLRNDSEIVDRVFGQLKSHVTCRNCGHVSVTFDEFNSLALPVPVKNKRKITVTLFPLPVGSIPIIVTLEVDLTSSIRDLKEALVTVLGPDVLMTAPAGRTRKRGLSLSSDDAMDIDSEPYVLVGADGESPKSGTDEQDEIKPMVKSASAMDVDQLPAPPAGDAAKKYFFHVASYSTYSKKVTWTLADDSPVQDITKNGSTQQLFVFQLEHDASKREYHEYDISAAVGYTSYSTYLSTEKKPKADEPGLRFVDVVMMRPPKPATSQSSGSYYSTYNYASTYPTLMGHGCRLSFEIGVTKYRDLYDKIEALALGLLPANSPYEGFSRRKQKNDSLDSEDSPAPPFVVYLSNQHGSNTGDEFPFDSDAAIDSIFARHQIIVMWSEDALTQLASASNDDPLETSTVEDNLFKRRKFNRGVVSAPFITDKEAIPNADQDSDKAEEKKRVNINDCLDKFIEREIMPEEETWYCPACKEHKSPIKKFDIWAAPEILIVQLKRFQYIPGSYFIHREKINDLVDFPIDGLDLTPYVRGEQRSDVPPPVYDLFAVSEHSGGLGGGHYTAVAKSPDSDDWINYNDSYCSRASTDDIVTPAAYILFYKRRGKDVKWAGIEPLPLGVLDQDKST